MRKAETITVAIKLPRWMYDKLLKMQIGTGESMYKIMREILEEWLK